MARNFRELLCLSGLLMFFDLEVLHFLLDSVSINGIFFWSKYT